MLLYFLGTIKNSRIKTMTRIVLSGFFLFVYFFGGTFFVLAEEEAYIFIDTDTVWHKDDVLVFHKEVMIDNNATLTIERGATVYFDGGGDADNIMGGLLVYWGNVIAEGTKEEPITITSHENAPFRIEFVDYEEGYEGREGKTSSLSYTDILNGGYYYQETEPCASMASAETRFFDFFIPSVSAATCRSYGIGTVIYMSGRVVLNNVNFLHNRYADIIVNTYFGEENAMDFFRVTSSNFGTNLRSTAMQLYAYCVDGVFSDEECAQKISLEGNWWGSSEGPYVGKSYFEPVNIHTSGDLIGGGDGMMLFRPFAIEMIANRVTDPSPCETDCFSNVLFVPGLEASRLYTMDDPDCLLINCENQLWEPNRNEDVRKLYLTEKGKSAFPADIYTRDIIEEINGTGSNVYHSFIDRLNTLKNDEGLVNDWAIAPYDWRLSLEDIIMNGTVSGDTISYAHRSETPFIESELRRLAASSRTGKVTIVAHSYGGLVTKALLNALGEDETKALIDTIVLVAVPQVGTPSALGAMLHGYGQGIAAGFITSESTARGLAQFMPSAYALLPSPSYCDAVSGAMMSFDPSTVPDWSAHYGADSILCNGIRNFVTDDFRRVPATDSDTGSPDTLSRTLYDYARETHTLLDRWTPPESVRLIQIAGWGVPLTLRGLHYTTKPVRVCEKNHCTTTGERLLAEPQFTLDGDGTVVTPSALWMGDTAERYWVDIKMYNKKNILSTIGGLLGINHSNILEISSLRDFIADAILHRDHSLDTYDYLSREVPSARGERLEYVLHSPLRLHLYDDAGHHTGILPDGSFEEGIPGTYYRTFGEEQYLFSESGAHYRVVLEGYAEGVFTLEVKSLVADTVTDEAVFREIPTTSTTMATLIVNGSVKDTGDLAIDRDGNGVTDECISAQKKEKVESLIEQSPEKHSEKIVKSKKTKKEKQKKSPKKTAQVVAVSQQPVFYAFEIDQKKAFKNLKETKESQEKPVVLGQSDTHSQETLNEIAPSSADQWYTEKGDGWQNAVRTLSEWLQCFLKNTFFGAFGNLFFSLYA